MQFLDEATKSTPVKKLFEKSTASFGRKFFAFNKRSQKNQPDLEAARKLADKGDLRKATEICEEYLDQFGPSADAFFLLGLVRDADNDTGQAEKLFRKALYLDPNHEEALVFLSFLAEKIGDSQEAKNLKQRLARLKNNTASHSSNR